ncbi:hypothetical protein ACFQFH_11390 [Halobaculum halobium]|uniref:Major facilitator superfamily (MFS) profile domain-containing protein n=1 Tax=Halobaculum halobium TaxID=3032281 RepID=A0ABD5TEQ5_9EURY|nr:hypothetical protein [Halobaculum sp. SYNS20]
MPSTTNDAGSLGRQIAFALAAAAVAAVVGTGQAFVPRLIDLSSDTVWLLTAASALAAVVSTVAAGVAGYAAGMREPTAAAVVRTATVFAVAAIVGFAAGLLVSRFIVDDWSGGLLVAVAALLARSVPFVAGGVAGAALSVARDASYSATRANGEV